MRHNIIFYFLFSLILLESSFGIEFTNDQQQYLLKKRVISMCVDPDWYPFEVIEHGKHKGIGADLIQLVSQKIKVPIVLVPVKSWEESIEFSKNRKCDIMSFLNETPKRKEWLTFTMPLLSDPNVLVGRSESDFIEDIGTIKASIALPRGTAMTEFFARDYPNLTIIPTTTENEAFKLVEEKKVDMTLRSMIITAYTIKEEGLFNLKIIGIPKGYENHLRIGVRNDEPILKDILNLGIEQISKEERENIINKYVKITVEQVTVIGMGLYITLTIAFIAGLILLWNSILRKKVALEVAKNEAQQKILFQKTKQAELGSLIANISHQWRDALSSISAINLETITKIDYEILISQEEMKKNANEIESSIVFMSETMHKFLAFYKKSDVEIEFGIQNSIDETLELIEMKIKHSKLEIIIDCKSDFRIKAIKNEWMNIWLNIIVNTINASAKIEIHNPKLEITIDNECVIFENNCGKIPQEILESLQQNAHSGLGIAMSKEILKKYNYRVIIENIEKGAKFTVKKSKL